MARFGPRQRQDPNITAYANWDPNQHNQMDAYADYTSRHHDPRERSINDRYDDTISAIQSGVIPSAVPPQVGLVPWGSAVSGNPRKPSTGPEAAVAGPLPEFLEQHVPGYSERCLADALACHEISSSSEGS